MKFILHQKMEENEREKILIRSIIGILINWQCQIEERNGEEWHTGTNIARKYIPFTVEKILSSKLY